MDDNYWQLCSTEDTNSGQGQTANDCVVNGEQQENHHERQVTLPNFQLAFGRNIERQVSQIRDASRASPACWSTESPAGLSTQSPACLSTQSPACLSTESPSCLSTESPSCLSTESPCLSTESPSCLSTESPSCLSTESPSCFSTESPSCFSTESPSCFSTESPPCFSTESPACLSTESPACLSTESPACWSTESPACWWTESPACWSTESPACWSTESPACWSTESPACWSTESPACWSTESPACWSTESPACWSTEAPACWSTEAPACWSTESPACWSTESPACWSTESPACWSTEAPIGVQSLAGLRHNIFQLEGIAVSGLQGAQVQGDHTQIISNAEILPWNLCHGTDPNLIAAGTVSSTPKNQYIEDGIPNQTVNSGTEISSHQLQKLPDESNKSHNVASVTNPATMGAPYKHSQVNEYAIPHLAIAATVTTAKLTKSQSSNSELNAPRRQPNCINPDKRNSESKEKHICHFNGCTKGFKYPSRLKAHIRSHTGEKPFVCTLVSCGKRYVQSDELQRHGSTHTAHQPQELSDDPNKFHSVATFTNPATMSAPNKHSQVNENAVPNLDIAATATTAKLTKSQTSNSELNAPRRRQKCTCPNCIKLDKRKSKSREKHACYLPGCTRVFKYPNKLKRHIRTHTGEKPFVCTWMLCGKRFGRSDQLQSHGRTHTDEKRFQCTECIERFKCSDHLSRHLKRHHSKRTLQVPT